MVFQKTEKKIHFSNAVLHLYKKLVNMKISEFCYVINKQYAMATGLKLKSHFQVNFFFIWGGGTLTTENFPLINFVRKFGFSMLVSGYTSQKKEST